MTDSDRRYRECRPAADRRAGAARRVSRHWRRCSCSACSSGDPSLLPSALIGHPAPQTDLPPIAGLERDGEMCRGIDPASFKGAVTVVNVWASWCVPCHDEAPLLMQLAQDKPLPAGRHQLQGRRRTMRGVFSAATAIRSPRPAPTRAAAPRSTGASMACRKPSSSAATRASPINSSARSRRIITISCSSRRSKRRWRRRSVERHSAALRRLYGVFLEQRHLQRSRTRTSAAPRRTP